MKKIKIVKKFLKPDNEDFITNTLLQPDFPYFLSDYDGTNKSDPSIPSYKFLGHSVLQRKEDRKQPGFNSAHTQQTLSILYNFFTKAGVKKVKFHRISYNYTFNIGVRKSSIHMDHEYPHSQAIIYLTDTLDKDTPTVILNDKKKVIKKIYPEKDKGVIFGRTPHYHVFPKKGARLVLVATFEEVI